MVEGDHSLSSLINRYPDKFVCMYTDISRFCQKLAIVQLASAAACWQMVASEMSI